MHKNSISVGASDRNERQTNADQLISDRSLKYKGRDCEVEGNVKGKLRGRALPASVDRLGKLHVNRAVDGCNSPRQRRQEAKAECGRNRGFRLGLKKGDRGSAVGGGGWGGWWEGIGREWGSGLSV